MANKRSVDRSGLMTGPSRTPIRTSKLKEEYEISKEIARGKFAIVYHATHRESGKQYAAKVVKKRRRGKTVKPEVVHEIVVLESCAHSPYIVNLYEVFEDDHDFTLILELATGGELQLLCDDAEDIKEEHVRKIVEQLLAGVHELHQLDIVHLDIKPSNILLASEDYRTGDFTIKLCDFGISRVVSNGHEVREILGTPDYVAPEVLNFDPISTATDLWSIGVLAYVLLTGISPFAGDDNQATYVNISHGICDFPEDLFADISPSAVDFIKRLLVKNPRNRMPLENCRKHHWITTPIDELTTNSASARASTSISTANNENIGTTTQALKSAEEQHMVQLSMLPARIVVSDGEEDRHEEEDSLLAASISSPPMRRPHQISTFTGKENDEFLSKRFKVREPQLRLLSPSQIIRRASVDAPISKSQVPCK